jgi:hypothetical protein
LQDFSTFLLGVWEHGSQNLRPDRRGEKQVGGVGWFEEAPSVAFVPGCFGQCSILLDQSRFSI